MNKKYLSVVLFGALMLGTAGTFTGCIDNDEPAGIEELRGAKAELLRAKVAVEAAIAARENANATLILAQAETEKAKAAYNEALAEKQRLENELQAAKNEEKKAYYEMLIAQHQQQMEKDILEHQKQMVVLQQQLAEAQRNYELALKAIEIAEAIVSDSQKVTLSELKAQLVAAQNNVDTKAQNVEDAQKYYYNTLLGAQADSVAIKNQELIVKRAEAELANKQEVLSKWNSFMENDTETADWRKEITALEDSIEGITRDITDLTIEKTKALNSDEYKALLADKTDAADKVTNHKTSADIKYTVWTNADAKTELKVAKGTSYTNAVVAITGDDVTPGYIDQLNELIAGYTSQKKALLDEIAADYEAKLAEAKKVSDNAVKAWQDAKTKYEAVGGYNATTALNTIKAAETAYWTAMNAASAIQDATQKANAEAIARINYAKALVAYYTEADKYVGCETSKVSLNVKDPSGNATQVTKTVLEWLSDENYSGVYLQMLMDNTVYSSTTAMYTVGGAIQTMGDKDSLLAALVAASNTAFGLASQYQTGITDTKGYMRVQPTEAEVKAIANYDSNCGALGKYYYVADPSTAYEAQNYKTIIADYEKAVAYFTEAATNLVAEHAELVAASKEADAAFKAFEDENIKGIEEEIKILTARIDALTQVKNELLAAVEKWLPATGITSTDSFESWLAQQVKDAEDAVIQQEVTVANEKITLEKLKDGKYDAVSYAKEALDKAMAELEAAQAELETVTANLQTALEIMAKE